MLPHKKILNGKQITKNSYKNCPKQLNWPNFEQNGESNPVPPEHSTLYKRLFERSYSIAVWKYHLCCYRSNLIFLKNIDFILPDKKNFKR